MPVFCPQSPCRKGDQTSPCPSCPQPGSTPGRSPGSRYRTRGRGSQVGPKGGDPVLHPRGHQVLRPPLLQPAPRGPPLQILCGGRLSLPWVSPARPAYICSSPFLTAGVARDSRCSGQSWPRQCRLHISGRGPSPS